jgi:hypothetical protein
MVGRREGGALLLGHGLGSKRGDPGSFGMRDRFRATLAEVQNLRLASERIHN